jgi:glycosyltransferase involved in cell wall biosynthesis
MRISLLHPSRGRPNLAKEAHGEWISKASGKHEIEYILSIDSNDDSVRTYNDLFGTKEIQILVNPNRSIVDAVNAAAKASDGEILIVVSDDFGCPLDWDKLVVGAFGNNKDAVLHVHDCLYGQLVTLPILTRTYYERLGYIYYPEYFSMFCDTELTYHARQEGKLIDALHLRFEHRHYTTGKTAVDETYLRENSNYAWAVGEKIFKERLEKGFPFSTTINP